MLNISRQAYSNYETGKRAPEIGLLVKLSEFYNVSLDDMIKQTISPYNGNGVIRERGGALLEAKDKASDNVLYITSDESELLMAYRTLTEDDKRLADKILKGSK